MLIKHQWVAYGLDMFGYLIIETEGKDIKESHLEAVKQLEIHNIDFDTLESFDESFRKRVNWL